MAYLTNIDKIIRKDRRRLHDYIHANAERNLCVVFDIGSKGIRVIVGPRMINLEFSKANLVLADLFYTASLEVNLGLNGGSLDVNKSESLKNIIHFINEIKGELLFLKKTDFALIGTASFRELNNRQQVLNQISAKAGLDVEVISGQEEAFYSLLAILYAYNKDTDTGENSVILLFDQGGRSTEIAYAFLSDPKKIKFYSMPDIGTFTLESTFIKKVNSYKGKMTNLGERVTVQESILEVEDYITEQLAMIPSFDEIPALNTGINSDYRIIVFGMGNAIKICFEEHFSRLLGKAMTGRKFSGWSLTAQELKTIYNKVKHEVIREFPTIKTLYAELKNNPARNNDLKPKLQLIYALPTYIKLMEKFSVHSISYGYYNLRYGVYFYKFVPGIAEKYPSPESPPQ